MWSSELPIWFPPQPVNDRSLDEGLANGRQLDRFRCPACGYEGPLGGFTENIRESGHCPGCGAWTRIRQLAVVLLEVGSRLAGRSLSTLADFAAAPLRIYNTEAHGTVHAFLAAAPGYVASEYFGPGMASGDLGPGGVLHEDLEHLSFPSDSFDLVVSTDVFEHLADPYQGHREVLRVLRPGGHHVFTVPYVEDSLLDDVRATRGSDGQVRLRAEALYHIDPVRLAEGALVYTIFGLEMLPKLGRLGFEVAVYRLWDPPRGLVGGPGIVFDAVKPLARATAPGIRD